MEVGSYILFQFRKIPIHRVKKKPEGLKYGDRSPPSPDAPETTEIVQGTGDEKLGIATLSLESELRSCWKVNG